jgi:signal transduction histidine kinase/DNA-binding NarL/FixJ family response regulator
MAEGSSTEIVRVLLLEDDRLDAELIVDRLERAGLTIDVTRATARKEFEAAVAGYTYDVILADHALPDFDGLSALALARKTQPGVPFIFISGRVGEEVAIETLQRGATDYVLKHRMERLAPAVLRAVKEAREHKARVQVEAMFRQSELRFQQVVNAVPQMIWLFDEEEHLGFCNQAWADYMGEDVHMCCDEALFHEDDYAEFREAWRGASASGVAFTLEIRLRRISDGTYRWHLMRIQPIVPELQSALDVEAPGIKRMWLGTATDIQDQKLNEQALRTAEKLSVTGRMAAAIAHEINNPLEALTNLLFLVRMESDGNPRALAFLDTTENELHRISAITKQTLQFYRDPAVPVPIDAEELLDEVLRLFQTRLNSKNIETSRNITPGITFHANKGEIRQVLINLVNNAIDAVPLHGRIDVEGHARTFQGAPAIEIRICDNGPGLTAEQSARLFQPFFSTKGAHGTGLGLWVSKGIVEKHGGSLRLHSHVTDGVSRTFAMMILPLEANAGIYPGEAASTIQ